MQSTEAVSGPTSGRLLFLYVSTLTIAVALFLMVRDFGEKSLVAPPPAGEGFQSGADVHASFNPLFHVLLAMAALIVFSRLLGLVCRWFHQPPVIGEVLAGILLGPSFLGWAWPDGARFLLPEQVMPHLNIIAQIGVILFMFLVGLELNTGVLRKQGAAIIGVSHAGIVFPFVLGSTFALVLYPRYSSSDVPFTVFAMFLGVSMAITAFPVLARILSERGLNRTQLGSVALACAATDDATAWCLLALVVGVAQAKLGGALMTLVWTAVYVAVMLAVVRPIAARWVAKVDERDAVSQPVAAVVFVALLASALTTELIGIHAIFGAFLLGAVIPHDSRIAREFIQKMEDLVGVLLLPAFFAVTGSRTQIGLIAGWVDLLFCVAVILVATAGKWAGCTAAGRVAGLRWRDAVAVGVLMNTRGLMELIVLNIGLDLKVLSPTLFTMLVVMAVVTTMTTTPVLDAITHRSSLANAVDADAPRQ
ncbi:MAG: cation:proton antiporter [Planctomycetia bacterium]